MANFVISFPKVLLISPHLFDILTGIVYNISFNFWGSGLNILGRAVEQEEFPLKVESGGSASQKDEMRVLSVVEGREVAFGGWLMRVGKNPRYVVVLEGWCQLLRSSELFILHDQGMTSYLEVLTKNENFVRTIVGNYST
jgi:hypothetical protein